MGCSTLIHRGITICLAEDRESGIAFAHFFQKNQDMTANGFLSFDQRHRFLWDAMQLVPYRYKPWGCTSIGPEVLKEAVLSRCNADTVAEVVGKPCRGVTVLPYHFFLPIRYKEWKMFFNLEHRETVWRKLRNSYVMHVYSSLSHRTPALSGSAYEEAARRHCPLSYRRSLELYGNF